MFHFSFLIILILLFTGCGFKKPQHIPIQIADLSTIPQTPEYYLNKIDNITLKNQWGKNKKYNQEYFKPWELDKMEISKSEAMCGFGYKKRQTYGQNYLAHLPSWYDKLLINSNFKQFNTYLKKGLVLKTVI